MEKMHVIHRNLFRLLRAGAFGEEVRIEPLSAWKWKRLYELTLLHDISALVYDGVMQCSYQFFAQLPEDLFQQWGKTVRETEEKNREINGRLSEIIHLFDEMKTRPILLKGQSVAQLYDNHLHRTPDDIDLFFPYEVQARKADEWATTNASASEESEKHVLQYVWKNIQVEHHHRAATLTNALLNRTLQNIISDEISSNDAQYVFVNATRTEVLTPTLSLLLMLIRNTTYIMNEGVSLKQITDLGIFLRKAGHRVDFVKLDSWMQRLGLLRFAQLQGAILTELLNFEIDELPFMDADSDRDISQVMRELFLLRRQHASDYQFQQGRGVFVHASNTSAMLWHVRHSARYFRYYPAETFTNFFANFAHSLEYIEE